MYRLSHNSASRGFGLIEIVVASALLTLVFVVIFNVAVASLRVSQEAQKKMQAALLLEEGAEAIRYLRDTEFEEGEDFASVFLGEKFGTPGTENCLLFDGQTYILDTIGNCTIGTSGFTRTARAEFGKRNDTTGVLDQNVGSQETDAGFITITVTWNGGEKSEELHFYLTNPYPSSS